MFFLPYFWSTSTNTKAIWRRFASCYFSHANQWIAEISRQKQLSISNKTALKVILNQTSANISIILIVLEWRENLHSFSGWPLVEVFRLNERFDMQSFVTTLDDIIIIRWISLHFPWYIWRNTHENLAIKKRKSRVVLAVLFTSSACYNIIKPNSQLNVGPQHTKKCFLLKEMVREAFLTPKHQHWVWIIIQNSSHRSFVYWLRLTSSHSPLVVETLKHAKWLCKRRSTLREVKLEMVYEVFFEEETSLSWWLLFGENLWFYFFLRFESCKILDYTLLLFCFTFHCRSLDYHKEIKENNRSWFINFVGLNVFEDILLLERWTGLLKTWRGWR